MIKKNKKKYGFTFLYYQDLQIRLGPSHLSVCASLKIMDPQNTLASYWINHSLRLQILIRPTHSSGWTIRHISLHGGCVKFLRCTLVWPNDQIEPWYWMNHPFTLTLQTCGNIPSISSLLYIPIEFYLVIYNNSILMYLVGFLHSWTAIDSIIAKHPNFSIVLGCGSHPAGLPPVVPDAARGAAGTWRLK